MYMFYTFGPHQPYLLWIVDVLITNTMISTQIESQLKMPYCHDRDCLAWHAWSSTWKRHFLFFIHFWKFYSITLNTTEILSFRMNPVQVRSILFIHHCDKSMNVWWAIFNLIDILLFPFSSTSIRLLHLVVCPFPTLYTETKSVAKMNRHFKRIGMFASVLSWQKVKQKPEIILMIRMMLMWI